MTPDRIAQAHATEAQLLARISVLLQRRAVDRRSKRVVWTEARIYRDVELRALVRIARSGRRLARETMERTDAVTASKAYADLGYHPAQAVGPVA